MNDSDWPAVAKLDAAISKAIARGDETQTKSLVDQMGRIATGCSAKRTAETVYVLRAP